MFRSCHGQGNIVLEFVAKVDQIAAQRISFRRQMLVHEAQKRAVVEVERVRDKGVLGNLVLLRIDNRMILLEDITILFLEGDGSHFETKSLGKLCVDLTQAVVQVFTRHVGFEFLEDRERLIVVKHMRREQPLEKQLLTLCERFCSTGHDGRYLCVCVLLDEVPTSL